MTRTFYLGRFQLGVFGRPGKHMARLRSYTFPESYVLSVTLPFGWFVFRWMRG